MTAVRRAVAAALVGLALGGCSVSTSVGGGTLNASEVEELISSQLAEQANVKAEVSCPDDVKPKAGHTFECTARSDDGATRQVRVTQKDDDGNVGFELI